MNSKRSSVFVSWISGEGLKRMQRKERVQGRSCEPLRLIDLMLRSDGQAWASAWSAHQLLPALWKAWNIKPHLHTFLLTTSRSLPASALTIRSVGSVTSLKWVPTKILSWWITIFWKSEPVWIGLRRPETWQCGFQVDSRPVLVRVNNGRQGLFLHLYSCHSGQWLTGCSSRRKDPPLLWILCWAYDIVMSAHQMQQC